MLLIANIIDAVGYIAHMLIAVYMLVLAAAFVIPWFNVPPMHPAVRLLRQVTDPVLSWVSRKMPFVRRFNGVDLSPLVVIIALELFDRIVVRSLMQMAHAL